MGKAGSPIGILYVLYIIWLDSEEREQSSSTKERYIYYTNFERYESEFFLILTHIHLPTGCCNHFALWHCAVHV